MFSVLSRRTLALAAASAALVGFTTACGAVETVATCSEATQVLTDYTTQISSAGADIEKINQANEDLSAKLKGLAGKSDGELASALNGLADTFGGIQIDSANPAGAATALADLSKNAQDAGVKLGSACG